MAKATDTFARNQNGALIINPQRLDIQSFKLVPDNPNNPVVVPAAGRAGPIPATIGQDGPAEAFYFTHWRDQFGAPLLVNIYDEGAQRYLMNREVHVDTIFGRSHADVAGVNIGIGPHILAESLFLHSSRALVFEFLDVVGGQGHTIWPVVTCNRYYGYSNPSKDMAIAIEQRAARARVSTPYYLTTDEEVQIGALVGTQAQAFMTIGSEGHFEWFKTVAVADGPFGYEIRDPRSGRRLMNGEVRAEAGTGTAAFPFIETTRNLFQANGQLELILTNRQAGANDVWFTLTGRRIYVR